MRTLSLALALLAAASGPVRSDGRMAALAAGGLTLDATGAVTLVAEDLYLSEARVRVDYRFRNPTGAAIEATIAFPMPDIAGDPDRSVSIPDPSRDNFLRLETLVDGRPVEPHLEQRAFLGRDGQPPREITDLLRSLSIPMVPTVEATEAALRRLSEDRRRILAEAGMLTRQVHADGTLADVPLWTLRSRFWHRQVFPAGREVVVRQSYVPSLGSRPDLAFGAPDLDPAERAPYEARFCADPAFARAAQALYRRASADGSRSFHPSERYLSYAIASGAGGNGPIGAFRLTVDKGDPASLVSFCGRNVRKTGPTTLEMEATDYTPERPIDVLLLKPTTHD